MANWSCIIDALSPKTLVDHAVCRIIFGCRKFFVNKKLAKKWEKMCFEGARLLCSKILGSCCLNSVPMSSDQWNSKNWLFWFRFLAKHFGFRSGWTLANFQSVFLQFLGRFQESSYLKDYIFEPREVSVRFCRKLKRKCRTKLFFRRRGQKFLAAEKLTKKIVEVFSQKTRGTFFLFSRSCGMPRLLLLSNRWSINN